MFHYDCEIHHRNGAIVTIEKKDIFQCLYRMLYQNTLHLRTNIYHNFK